MAVVVCRGVLHDEIDESKKSALRSGKVEQVAGEDAVN